VAQVTVFVSLDLALDVIAAKMAELRMLPFSALNSTLVEHYRGLQLAQEDLIADKVAAEVARGREMAKGAT
jgi:hypothetical protein